MHNRKSNKENVNQRLTEAYQNLVKTHGGDTIRVIKKSLMDVTKKLATHDTKNDNRTVESLLMLYTFFDEVEYGEVI